MMILTKGNQTGASLAANTEVDVAVTGFGFTPEFVLAAQVNYGIAADDLIESISYPGSMTANELSIVKFAFTADTVTITLRNNDDATAQFYDNIIITAGKNDLG